MKRYRYISTGFLSILALGFLLYLPADSGGTSHRVWLVNGEQIIEYDPSIWTVVRSIEIPKHASQNPERLQITPSGTMVFCPDPYPGTAYSSLCPGLSIKRRRGKGAYA